MNLQLLRLNLPPNAVAKNGIPKVKGEFDRCGTSAAFAGLVFAASGKGRSVLNRLTPRAVVAHEAGHMLTDRAGKGFAGGSLLDEVQASLIGRNLPGLNKVERYQLLRDAAERARNEGQSLRNLLPQLNH